MCQTGGKEFWQLAEFSFQMSALSFGNKFGQLKEPLSCMNAKTEAARKIEALAALCEKAKKLVSNMNEKQCCDLKAAIGDAEEKIGAILDSPSRKKEERNNLTKNKSGPKNLNDMKVIVLPEED